MTSCISQKQSIEMLNDTKVSLMKLSSWEISKELTKRHLRKYKQVSSEEYVNFIFKLKSDIPNLTEYEKVIMTLVSISLSLPEQWVLFYV